MPLSFLPVPCGHISEPFGGPPAGEVWTRCSSTDGQLHKRRAGPPFLLLYGPLAPPLPWLLEGKGHKAGVHVRALKDFICRQEENKPTQHACSGPAGGWRERQRLLEARNLIRRASKHRESGWECWLGETLEAPIRWKPSTLLDFAYTSVH